MGDVADIYTRGDEQVRLGRDSDRVEWVRTLDLLHARSCWRPPGQLGDPDVRTMLATVMRDGTDPDGGLSEHNVYRHHPAELRTELIEAGFRDTAVIGVEGPLGAYARMDPALHEMAARIAALIADADASIHLLATGTRTLDA